MFDNKVNDVKSIWQNINKLLNKQNLKTNQIDCIINDGNEFHNPNTICCTFNEYFCSVGEELSERYSQNNIYQNISTNFMQYLGSNNSNSFYCSDVSTVELIDVIKNLKPSKSFAEDSISSFLLKKIYEPLINPLLYICNLSLEYGIFPDKLKNSKIIPVFKKGDKKCLFNYRSISIISPFAKILKKLMYSRLVSFWIDIKYYTNFSLVFENIIPRH